MFFGWITHFIILSTPTPVHKGGCKDYSLNKVSKGPGDISKLCLISNFLMSFTFRIKMCSIFCGCDAQSKHIVMLYNRSIEFLSDAQWHHISEWTSHFHYKGLSNILKKCNNWRRSKPQNMTVMTIKIMSKFLNN